MPIPGTKENIMNDNAYQLDEGRDSSADNCTNDGPACYSCPCFDFCASHEDTE